MDPYKNILVAVDFSSGTQQVMQRAVQMAQQEASALSVVHVVEPAPVDFLDQTMLVDINLDEMLLKNAKKQLQELCAQFGVPENRVHLKIGAVKTEVFEIIEATKTDCLIVGSHGRHGLGLLLGSTANSLLHGSQCDVLAVRIKD